MSVTPGYISNGLGSYEYEITPMLNRDFLPQFKKITELTWSQQSIDPAVYGFQFQCGTRWNPGLSDKEIEDYENVLRVQFPLDLRAFLPGHYTF